MATESRASKDYGLPALTFDEAARVLGLQRGEWMAWLMEAVSPGPDQWSKWKSGKATVPEALIRLYLTQRLAQAKATAPPERRKGRAG